MEKLQLMSTHDPLSISSTFPLQSYGDAGVHLGHVASLSQG